MSTTLTLKNIPDEVYEQLKASAERHGRSLNSEAIACLETVLLPGRMTLHERLTRARRLRAALSGGRFESGGIAKAKRAGKRPHPLCRASRFQ